jgi:hypothetical protein
MTDIEEELTGNDLVHAVLPEEPPHEVSSDSRSLREIVIAPEEVLLFPISINNQPLGEPQGAELQERLRKEIDTVLRTIEDPTVREIADTILSELSQLFSRLTLVESNLRKLDTLQENLSILEMMQFDIHSLVQFIQYKALPAEGLGERLHDVLDGISYGISHDAKRIFERGLLGNVANQTTPVVYGKILHAHGLLANCFQQSAITFLQVFNPAVNPVALFDDFESRLKQSLALCRDLSSLMRVVHNAQLETTPDNLRVVVESVMEFRDGSMQYLMYRDWRGYEKLALELINAIEHNRDPKDLLHQFTCYLEVLYGHVKMRAVLRDMFPSSRELS